MQEVTPEGENILTGNANMDAVNATMDKLAKAQLTQLHIYEPGEIVTLSSGVRYRIGEHAEWIKLQD